MKTIPALIILALSVTFCFSQEKRKPKSEVLFSFCPLSISEGLAQANFTATDIYSFKIDKEGKPFDLKRVSWRFVDDEEVKACIGEWKFTGFEENRRFVVSFSWKHMYGWVSMILSSKGFSQKITQFDER